MINLVTGGAGFVGSHLIERLMSSGEEVICLDNYITGRKSNIKKWIGNPYFELIRHDVTEPIKLEIDRIWHLACPASPIHYQNNPIKTSKTSFLGTYNLLGLARRVGAKFLLASTSEIELKETQIRAWSSVLVYIKDKQRKQEISDIIIGLQAEVESLEQASASQSL